MALMRAAPNWGGNSDGVLARSGLPKAERAICRWHLETTNERYAGSRYRMRIEALALCLSWRAGAFIGLIVTGPVFCPEGDTPPLPQWLQLCGPDFVSFVGRRWLIIQQRPLMPRKWDARRSQLLDRSEAFHQICEGLSSTKTDLRAFVAVDLGNHRLSKDGNPIDIVISGDGYRHLMICLARKTRP